MSVQFGAVQTRGLFCCSGRLFGRAGGVLLFERVFLGGDSVFLAEHGGKLRRAGKAAFQRHLRAVAVRLLQHLFRLFQPQVNQIVLGRDAVFFLKAPAGQVKCHAHTFGKTREVDFPVHVLVNKAPGV